MKKNYDDMIDLEIRKLIESHLIHNFTGTVQGMEILTESSKAILEAMSSDPDKLFFTKELFPEKITATQACKYLDLYSIMLSYHLWKHQKGQNIELIINNMIKEK